MRTVLVSLDLSRAFDTVNHDKLLQKINSTSLHNNIKRWLSAYLKGREQSVVFGSAQSKFKGSLETWIVAKSFFLSTEMPPIFPQN